MKVLTTLPELRQWRGTVGTVGLVPTMGYLHAGHLALVGEARRDNSPVIVSVFVNPTQFAATDDLSAYPRDVPRDLALLEAEGVDAVFLPTVETMYPRGFQTSIHVESAARGKEGARRPGHFSGVATVVTKLLLMTGATRAYFGQKDAQQVVVVRRVVADLNIPTQIVICPIVREADGLAMSSRNVYLTPDERLAASVISRALSAVATAYAVGNCDPWALQAVGERVVEDEPLAALDYLDISDARTFETSMTASDDPLIVSITVRLGKPYLLDNLLLPVALNTREGATAVLGAVIQ